MLETVAIPSPLHGAECPGVLVVATPDRIDRHAGLIKASGARLLDLVAPGAAAARIAQQIALDLIFFDATGLPPADATEAAIGIVDSTTDLDCRIVVLLDRAGIDAIAGTMLAAGAVLLCEARPEEIAAALGFALAPHPTRLHDGGREREAERLRLLNEEVARFAEVLTQLASERADTAVRDRASAFRAEPATTDPDPRTVRATIRARRLRDQYFHAELFADPAWDMLLDLYAARLEGRRVSVSSLCIAAAVPPTTALRWIGTMHDAQLFGREPDPTDKRRAHITLTERAANAMRGYFDAAARTGLTVMG